jgi:formiminotetrahydrofolate cyclodeaminase
VAALAAQAGLEGAALNVLINLGAITDKTFTEACRAEVERLVSDGRRLRDAVLAHVISTFSVKGAMQGQSA